MPKPIDAPTPHRSPGAATAATPSAGRPAGSRSAVNAFCDQGDQGVQGALSPPNAQGAGDYAVLLARDARFDGRLFVGVTSTGIYCRPVCRVRVPLQRNCRFFSNAAQAETQGFRPCLRCRPELAPGLSLVDSSQALARHAARLLDHAVAQGQPLSMPALAARLGVTDRHLRRIFAQAHGVSPLQWLGTQRLLLAKQLLTDTQLPINSIALASGYASLRRFNAAFVGSYRLSPSRLRKAGRPLADEGANEGVDGGAEPASHRLRPHQFQLHWRPPYDVDGVLRYFADRAVPGIESVQGHSLRRTWALEHAGQRCTGWVSLQFEPQNHALRVEVAPGLTSALGPVLQQLRQAFDLDADPERIAAAMLAVPAEPRAGLRLPSGVCGFEMAVRVVLGQQVTVAAARTLTLRLVAALGEPIETPFPDLNRLFPSARAIAEADPALIGQLGIVRQRVRALQALAAAVHSGAIELHRAAPLEATLDALRALPGVGEWTAQLVAMRALAWPDAFPASDIGLLNALGTRDVAAVQAQAEAWRPWRAYAVMRLWQTLETSAAATRKEGSL